MSAPARATTDATTNAAATSQPATSDLVAVFAFNQATGDFDALPALRRSSDEYELLEAPEGGAFGRGDLVRCELSDGELIVRERIFGTRLL